jgi:hypothetical protein
MICGCPHRPSSHVALPPNLSLLFISQPSQAHSCCLSRILSDYECNVAPSGCTSYAPDGHGDLRCSASHRAFSTAWRSLPYIALYVLYPFFRCVETKVLSVDHPVGSCRMLELPPEIWDNITARLNRRSLARVSATCRALRNACLAQLFESLRFTPISLDLARPSLGAQRLHDDLDALRRSSAAQYVKKLEIVWHDERGTALDRAFSAWFHFLQITVAGLASLQDISLRVIWPLSTDDILAILSLDHLSHLSLDDCICDWAGSVPDTIRVQLQSLHYGVVDGTNKQSLLSVLLTPHLQRLCLPYDFQTYEPVLWKRGPLSRVTHLSLPHYSDPHLEVVFLLSRVFPHVEALHIKAYSKPSWNFGSSAPMNVRTGFPPPRSHHLLNAFLASTTSTQILAMAHSSPCS